MLAVDVGIMADDDEDDDGAGGRTAEGIGDGKLALDVVVGGAIVGFHGG